LTDLVKGFNHIDQYPNQIIKACQFIYPLSNAIIRKVKTLKKPKFDITKLNELHKEVARVETKKQGKGDKGDDGADNTKNLLDQ